MSLSHRERTASMAIIDGFIHIIYPIGEFCGGQIFKYGGFYPVYFTALGTALLGLIYTYSVPESIICPLDSSNDNEKKPGFVVLWKTCQNFANSLISGFR